MNILKQPRFILPLIIFALIVMLLWRGLELNPTEVPSPLINKPSPTFQSPELFKATQIITNADFIGQVTLFNVWATWCYACALEHDFLMQLAKDHSVNIYGLNYKNDPVLARKWLAEYGNPYKIVAVDQSGSVAIDWGVYGTPETFIIDKKGVIRYKHIGPITADVWAGTLQPIVQKLEIEKA